MNWLKLKALVHYPSYLAYEVEKANAAHAKTVKAIDACVAMKVAASRSSSERAEKIIRTVDQMLTLLETRMTLIQIRLSDLDCRRALYRAFDVKTNDSMADLTGVNEKFDKAFMDLAASLQGAK